MNQQIDFIRRTIYLKLYSYGIVKFPFPTNSLQIYMEFIKNTTGK